ncbi:MAG: hypothetical protein ACOX57_00670 [Limnochordia bacterium]
MNPKSLNRGKFFLAAQVITNVLIVDFRFRYSRRWDLLTNDVMEIGVREPDPKIFPPSIACSVHHLFARFPRKLNTQMLEQLVFDRLSKTVHSICIKPCPDCSLKAMIPP